MIRFRNQTLDENLGGVEEIQYALKDGPPPQPSPRGGGSQKDT